MTGSSMRPERLAEIDALFEALIDLDGEERSRRLAERAAADPELAAEVERLLAAGERSFADPGAPIREFARRVPIEDEPTVRSGETLGAYTLIRTLGEGGMGVVFLAERTDGSFERRVALKLLHASGGGAEAVRRFEQERQILARLSHPGIAHLLDGGVDARGLPYLVMEHVEGRPIDVYCDDRRLTVNERLALLVEVANAVQAAHRNLVVHRDLKPSNVLVTAEGAVKLLDFGIAKLIDPALADGEGQLTRVQPMTPTYASPEQVSGGVITTAADVYQLGLLLYELATGRRPQAARSTSLSGLVELVCKVDPPAPSRAVRTEPEVGGSSEELAALRGATPAKLARAFRPELDAIAARALAKDPERRYSSAAEFAADLERYLDGRPVRARQASIAYRIRRWVGRNRALAAAGALAAAAVVGYAITVTVQARAIDQQRQRAESEATKALAVETFLTDLFETSDPARAGREITAKELIVRGTERIDRELADQPAVQARLWGVLGQIHENLGEAEAAQRLIERALAAQTRLYGEDHPDTAQTLRRLGALQRHLVDRELGERTLLRALEIQRRVLPPDSEELAKTLYALGVTRNFAADSESAERYLVESLEIYRRIHSLTGIASCTNSLGVVALNRNDLDEAEARFREGLELNRQVRGPCSPTVAVSLYNLANLLNRRGEHAAALELFRQVTAIDTEAYGPHHSEVGIDLVREAQVEQRLGRLDRADTLYRESLEILMAKLPPSHLRLQEARYGLGQLRVRQKRFAEAEPLLREPLEARRRRVGAGHSGMRGPLLWYGRALAGLGRRDEAIAAWKEGAAITPDLRDEVHAHLRLELEATAGPQEAAGDSSSR